MSEAKETTPGGHFTKAKPHVNRIPGQPKASEKKPASPAVAAKPAKQKPE